MWRLEKWASRDSAVALRATRDCAPGVWPQGDKPRYILTNLRGSADRLSSHYFAFNPFRLLLASLAYALIERLRALAFVKNTRRIRVLLASGYPYCELFLHAARSLAPPVLR